MTPHYSKDRVAEAIESLGMPALCSRLGLEMKQSGRAFWAPCPFHEERSASFKVEQRGARGEWRWHCFGGCGGGDGISLWMKAQNCSFPDALADLASLAGVGPETERSRAAPPAPRPVKPLPEKRIILPPLRKLSDETCAALASLRGLSVEGIQSARAAGILWGGLFGLAPHGIVWGERMEWEQGRGKLWEGPHRCWFVSDGRKCATVRRLDGEEWPRREGKGFKSYAIGTKKWPMGILNVGERPCVAIVEGEPDMLAAYHFIHAAGKLDTIAPVAVLGAAASMPEDVWPCFRGKHVRLFPHYDKVDAKTGRRTGWEAAAKWEAALLEAGAASVRCFWFGTCDEDRLMRADGVPVKDLNDAALGDADCREVMARCFAEEWGPKLTFIPWSAGARVYSPVKSLPVKEN